MTEPAGETSTRLKGWFKIPNLQDGDRTLEQQVFAVRPAIAEAAGKRVLDLGCAEGLLGREFALAGAACVVGIDSLPGHIAVAQQVCAGLPMRFEVGHLGKYGTQPLPAPYGPDPYEIVLALGVCHKLRFPDVGVRMAARESRDLVLFRSGRGVTDGIMRSKNFHTNTCDVHAIMREAGFDLEKIVDGPPDLPETVEYWRKK